MYWAAPDGNQMEFQVDVFYSSEQAGDHLSGPDFEANSIGVEYVPEDWLAHMRSAKPLSDFFRHKFHEAVSPIRGAPSE